MNDPLCFLLYNFHPFEFQIRQTVRSLQVIHFIYFYNFCLYTIFTQKNTCLIENQKQTTNF
jgi:hypothetical protein